MDFAPGGQCQWLLLNHGVSLPVHPESPCSSFSGLFQVALMCSKVDAQGMDVCNTFYNFLLIAVEPAFH